MNRIYLFLAALFVAISAQGVTLHYSYFVDDSETWQTVEMAADGDVFVYKSFNIPSGSTWGNLYIENDGTSYGGWSEDTNGLTETNDNYGIGYGPSSWETATDTGTYLKINLDAFSTYDLYFQISGDDGTKIWVTNKRGGLDTGGKRLERDGYYYLYADMNRWSLNQNAGDEIVIRNLAEQDITKTVWPDDQFGNSTAPKYCTQEELDRDWKFEKCSAPEGQSGDDWYKIDFKERGIKDALGNVGRLCGQFKITMGFYRDNNTNNWGPSLGTNQNDENVINYLKNKIDVNSLYTGFQKNSGLQNFQLNCSYVQDAVLYFNPTDNQIYLTGTPVYKYVYYVISSGLTTDGRVNSESTQAPQAWELSDMSQENYWANSKGFNDGSAYTGIPKNGAYNIDNMYNWELVNNPDDDYNGTKFTKAYRRLIPYGAVHRFPVEFNVRLRGANGTEFDRQAVDCENIWFIEASVNLYFRYESGYLPSWVGYNAFTYHYDSEGIHDYDMFAYSDDAATSKTNKWQLATGPVSAQGPADSQPWLYFKSRTSLPLNYASDTYAIFLTSEGAVYPTLGTDATGDELMRGAISGTDLYYVVPDEIGEVGILYSHLKGSYCKDREGEDGEVLQIQAEFFNEDGTLDTTFKKDDTKYAFLVYKYDDTTKSLRLIANSGTGSDPYVYDPYFDWNESVNADAGYYHVVVKVIKNGVEYKATDNYPVFENYR